ncbi:UNVERIFIED_CONTAM: hypothetical protein FKN15_032905 [Acipenser sinensis]
MAFCRHEKLIAYQREFHALKERLRVAEHRTLQRSSELNTILEQFRRAIAETNGSKDALGHFSVSIVMGIPTVKRKVKSYLAETLHSLINKLSPEEKLDCVIIVFVGEKHCERQKSNLRFRFRPSLFQHVGLHSSLAGKIQKLTGYTLEKTYLGEDFFWAITPTAGDYILFKFDRPVNIERYLFRSGNPEHPGDKLQNTTVEILPFSETGLKTKDKYKRTDDGFYRIGKFENGVSESAVDPVFNPISALRLSILQDSAVWAILSEVRV